MKRKREAAATAEMHCERLGDLASLAVSAKTPSPGTEQWAEIERRLDRRWRGPSPRRLWPALAVSAVAVLCAGGWLVARRPLGYRVVNCTLAADGVLATALSREGAIAFEDGSRMSVEKDARFRLEMLPFGHGAKISLDEGEANLSVVHRDGARWSVQAGPFRVEVTGTRFGMRWSRQLGRFRITILEGEVLVAGGAIPPATHLRAGQTLSADLLASSFAIADDRSRPTAAPGTGTTGAVQGFSAGPAKQNSTGSRGVRPSLPPPSPRKRTEVAARDENPPVGGPEPTQVESALDPAPPAQNEPAGASAKVAPTAPQHLPPTTSTARPVQPWPAVEPKSAIMRVVIGETGQLSNGFSGAAWVAGGEGTSFSAPASWDARAHLRPEAGLLCTGGTIAGFACVNEGTPNFHCNWDRNWGVVISWHARADQKAWGDDAMGAIAVDFHGRSASYRLKVHLKGDPEERIYCIENYKSGQVVRPSMFKSECWFDKGETLADFKQVDSFDLQFPSGIKYVAFRYCISGITLLP